MNKDKLILYIFGLSYAILLGSFVYIFPDYKELWLFLEVITLPSIYMIGYEILMSKEQKQRKGYYEDIRSKIDQLGEKAIKLEEENKLLKTERIK